MARPVYKATDDLKGYLAASSVLDKVRNRVVAQRLGLKEAREVLQKLLQKITAKEISQCRDE